MTSNIIQLPQSQDSKRRLQELEEALQRERWELVAEVRRRAQDPRAKFAEEKDRKGPAQEIDRLIRENQIIKPKKINERLAREGRRGIHLERLRLDGTKPVTESTREKAKTLRPTLQPYVQVLEALAGILNKDADELIFEAFRRSSFAHATEKIDRAEDLARAEATEIEDRIEELAHDLNELARAVIRTEKLSEYFEQAYKTAAEYDPVVERFFPGGSPLPKTGFLEEGFDRDAWPAFDAPPWFPGASIIRVPRASLSGPVFVENAVVAGREVSQAEAARIVSRLRPMQPRQVGPGGVREAKISLFTNIRLVIGPRNRAGDLGPMFELRTFITLETEKQDRPLTFPYSIKPLVATEETEELELLVGSVAARFDDGWHRVVGITGEWSGDIELPKEPHEWTMVDSVYLGDPVLGKAGGGWESLVTWTAVNGPTVEQLLKLFQSSDRGAQILFEANGPHPEPTELSFGQPVCREFETALYTGAFEASLRADCRRLEHRLQERIVEARETRQREREAFLQRLNKDMDAG